MNGLVYIAGYGRSGSTILDTVLGNHPSFVGAGELTHAFSVMEADSFCSCGSRAIECPLWGRVKERMIREIPGIDFRALNKVTREEEDILGPRGRSRIYQRAWGALVNIILEVSGAQFVVDSSKSTWKVARRIGLLKQGGIEIRLIHLVRNPAAVMWSIQRGSNRLLEQGENPKLRGGMVRGLASWVASNLLFERYKKRVGAPFMRIRYEDMVSRPAFEMKRIGKWLDVDMGAIVRKISNHESFSPGHGISGNRMRRQGEIRIDMDRQWTKAMPLHGRLLALLGYPLAKRYGYTLAQMAKR
jgi:hypothetical protein